MIRLHTERPLLAQGSYREGEDISALDVQGLASNIAEVAHRWGTLCGGGTFMCVAVKVWA